MQSVKHMLLLRHTVTSLLVAASQNEYKTNHHQPRHHRLEKCKGIVERLSIKTQENIITRKATQKPCKSRKKSLDLI